MTERAFELLDELYFVIKFEALQAILGWKKEVLLAELIALLQKNWVKCLDAQDNIYTIEPQNLPNIADTCLFLATKEGLKAHHSTHI